MDHLGNGRGAPLGRLHRLLRSVELCSQEWVPEPAPWVSKSRWVPEDGVGAGVVASDVVGAGDDAAGDGVGVDAGVGAGFGVVGVGAGAGAARTFTS